MRRRIVGRGRLWLCFQPGFTLQFVQMALKGRGQLALGAAKFRQALAEQFAEFRQLLRSEQKESEEKNQHHLLHSDRSHIDASMIAQHPWRSGRCYDLERL